MIRCIHCIIQCIHSVSASGPDTERIQSQIHIVVVVVVVVVVKVQSKVQSKVQMYEQRYTLLSYGKGPRTRIRAIPLEIHVFCIYPGPKWKTWRTQRLSVQDMWRGGGTDMWGGVDTAHARARWTVGARQRGIMSLADQAAGCVSSPTTLPDSHDQWGPVCASPGIGTLLKPRPRHRARLPVDR